MTMAQIYQGYFLEDGRLMANGLPIRLPVRRRVIVNVLDEVENDADISIDDSTHNRQASAVKRFLENISVMRDGENTLSDDDWNEMLNLRSKTNDGMSRDIEV